MLFKRTVVFSLCMLLYQSIQAAGIEEYERNIEHWIEVSVPSQNEKITSEHIIWSNAAANQSKYEWVVFRENNKIKATLKNKRYQFHKTMLPPSLTRRELGDGIALISTDNEWFYIKFKAANRKKLGDTNAFIQTDDGWLVSFNYGEFGAALWWFSKNGIDSIKISEHHVNQFIALNNKFYAIEGLSHLGLSDGSIIEIVNKNGIWTTNKMIQCHESPEVFDIYDEHSFIIVFHKSIGIFQKDGDIKIITQTSWNGLYPNSLVLSSDNSKVYIGMRQYVSEVNITSGKVKYLIPNQSFLNTLSNQ